MPLHSGSSKAAIQTNIRILIHEGYEPKQAEAIAYAEARRTSRKSIALKGTRAKPTIRRTTKRKKTKK